MKTHITYRFFDSPGHKIEEFQLYGDTATADLAMDSQVKFLKSHGHPVIYQACWFTADHSMQNCKFYSQPLPPAPKPQPKPAPEPVRQPRRGSLLPFSATRRGGRTTSTYVPPVIAGPFDVGQHVVEQRRARARTLVKQGALPFTLGGVGVGDPISLTFKYKGILVAWSQTHAQTAVANYGTVAEDVSTTWNCMRDGRVLASFSKWWNSTGRPPINEGYFPKSGVCKDIWVADLDAVHTAALDEYSVSKDAIPGNFPSYSPPGVTTTTPTIPTVDCAADCAAKFGAGGANPSVNGYLACMAACAAGAGAGQQPSQTPGGAQPSTAEPPLPPPAVVPGVTDCDPNNPCPSGQQCVDGKCVPAVVPPSGAAAKTESNTGAWLVGGGLLLGAIALITMGTRGAALSENPYSRPGERVRHLTYREALAAFKRRYAGPKNDKPRMGYYWSMYIDELAREGLITEKQASTWDNPFYR
jgi:hypothetical protein